MKKFISFLPLLFLVNFLTAQIDISEARTKAIDDVVTIQGVVTHGPDNLGPIRYIQDATGALPIYSPGDFADAALEGVEIKVTGALTEFRTLLQIGTVNSFEVISTGNDLPTPLAVTPGQMGADNEAQLVTISGVTFADGGTPFNVGTFGFSANGESSVTYVRSGHSILGTTIPLANVNITGIVSVFNDSYQLLLRGPEDLEIADAFYVTKNPVQTNIDKTSFTLSWETNDVGTTVLKYGTTPDMDQEVTVSGETTTHSVDLTGLEPATFYYAKAESVKDGNTIESSVGYFSTVSESSGEMKVLFNRISDPSISTGLLPATNSPADIENAIVDMIDNAKSTVDVAMFNNNRVRYRTVLEAAKARGVQVRYITNIGTLNSGLSNPNPTFPVLPGNTEALMHNKFVIIDADDVDDCWVLGGSMNWTDQNEVNDYNNMIFIQDQALAKAYTVEFEEMWGSEGPNQGIFSVKFGPAKTDNVPHNYVVNGTPVDLYFSPTDNTTLAIENAIKSAENDLQFATLSFTRNELGTAVRNAHSDGVDVRGIIENINDQGGEYAFLVDQGVNVLDHPPMGSIHHKYAIIDANGGDDPMVVTGSHNWSTSAEDRNDENTLIIHSGAIANLFMQEFEQRWCELTNTGNCFTSVFDNNRKPLSINVSPNPMVEKGFLNIDTDETFKNVSITVYDLNGKVLESRFINFQKTIPLDLSYYSRGSYFVEVIADDYRGIVKVLRP